MRRVAAAAAAAIAALLAGPLHAGAVSVQLPTGQTVDPAGTLTTLDSFPTGVAYSPDGTRLAVIAGPALSSEGPPVVVEVLDASTRAVQQTLKVNDAFQGIAWSGNGSTIYVAGGQDGVVHVFTANSAGVFTPGTDLAPAGCTFVSGVALSHDGASAWVACPLDSTVHHMAIPAGTDLGHFPATGADELAVSTDDQHVYATDWRGTVTTRIDVAGGVLTPIAVGDHPDGVVALPDGRAVVTDANDGTVATLAPPAPGTVLAEPAAPLLGLFAVVCIAGIAARRSRRGRRALLGGAGALLLVIASLHGTRVEWPVAEARADTTDAQVTDVSQGSRYTDAPNAVVATADGSRLFVSLGADNAVAELVPQAQGAGPWRVAGLIPTGWYPVALALSPDQSTLQVVTARGLGNSPAATVPYQDPDPVDTGVNAAYATAGTLESVAVPDAATLAADTATARAGFTPAGPPAPDSVLGPGSPIKHVIYITRENKTYDADLGDLHPGPQNALTLFGRDNTPNLHELETTFVEAQNFYYPGFRSTVGHMWEDAGGPSDVYERASGADTGANQGDWGDPENYPSTGLLVSQVLKAGMTVRTYNEELAQQSGLVPPSVQAPQSVFVNYNLAISDTSREMGWETEFRQFEAHRCTGDLATTYGADCSLPSLEYVYLGEDHTTVYDEPGYPTVEAQVADNDYATARVIDAVSHSPDWSSTLVIVVEDDPQGTGDDMSAYHGFVALASPWVKRGYISTARYDLPSAIGAIDDILGLPSLTDYVAEARPLDDLFASTPDDTPFTADTSGITLYPFTALPGLPPASDPAHGIFSFTEPDRTDPALAWRSTWMLLKGHAPAAS